MIYTLTVAPSIDYTLDLNGKELRTDGINRPIDKGFSIGGKGITVSRMLKNLKIESVPLVAAGGPNGETIKQMIDTEFGKAIYIPTVSNSRIDVLITGPDTDLRFDPSAPKIKEEGLKSLFDFFKERLKKDDIVVMAGSLGQEDKHLYQRLMDECINPSGAKTILDTVNECLLNALGSKPFMIKPNDEELGDILGKKMVTDEDILKGGEELKLKGPKTVMVTLGRRGAFYFAENGSVYHCSNAVGKQISAVGAGDSSIAGFIKGLSENRSIEETLQYSMAAGGATAFSEHLGSFELWESLIPQIKVTKIK